MSPQARAAELMQLRRMRTVSLIEGSTLLLLLLVAVPLKHLAGIFVATRIMGSVHGFAFLAYMWMLIQTVSGGGWSRAQTLRLVIAALIPCGAFINERALARRQAMLEASCWSSWIIPGIRLYTSKRSWSGSVGFLPWHSQPPQRQRDLPMSSARWH